MYTCKCITVVLLLYVIIKETITRAREIDHRIVCEVTEEVVLKVGSPKHKKTKALKVRSPEMSHARSKANIFEY